MDTCPIDSIIIPEDRQRTVPADLKKYARSITRYGILLQPINITRDRVLISGFCRLTALRDILGWTEAPVNYIDVNDPKILRMMELEENTIRTNLCFQDRVAQHAEAHEYYCSIYPRWTQADTAAELGVEQPNLSKHLEVAAHLHHPAVAKAATLTLAHKEVKRIKTREADELMRELGMTEPDDPTILCCDFNEWAPRYEGTRFNLIHCDFPYGVGSDKFGQGATDRGTYADSPEVYERLCCSLAANLDRLVAPSAHLFFWFPPERHQDTLEFLRGLRGFIIEEVPLIWHKSDNTGISPDHTRRPRRIYESAFFGWRGTRTFDMRSNLFGSPVDPASRIHPHEKPQEMLEYFFGMVVSDTTRILDPTCGSGAALRAGLALGAEHAQGLEIDEAFCMRARRKLSERAGK